MKSYISPMSAEALSNQIVIKCGLWVLFPDIIEVIALIIFGWRDHEIWVFLLTREVTFTTPNSTETKRQVFLVR